MNWSIAQTEVMMSMEMEQVSIDLGKLKRLQNEAIQKVILICGGMHKRILLQYSCMLVCLKMKVGSLLYNLTKWACTCPPSLGYLPTWIYVSKDPDRLGLAQLIFYLLFFSSFFPYIFSLLFNTYYYTGKKNLYCQS